MGLCLLAGACDRGPTQSEPGQRSSAPPVLDAQVAAVRSLLVPTRIEVTGQVAARFRATLSSQLRAKVESVAVHEGQPVKKGEALVRLDPRDVDASLARAEAEFEHASAQAARMERLFQEDSVARQELEHARRAAKVADAGRQAALAQRSHGIVVAPFDGIVTEKKVEVGELASPGQPLVTVEDASQLRLEATVAESDLAGVTLGAILPVTVDALSAEPLRGTVGRILPAGDPATHTFVVKVDLPQTLGLKSGMFGRLQLEKGSQPTLAVPATAIIERGQLTGVFALNPDSVAHLRWVTVGRRLNGDVEVLSGVNIGERVLLTAAQGADGAKIRIADATP
jgi:RND family efflux transporter MFP subunit